VVGVDFLRLFPLGAIRDEFVLWPGLNSFSNSLAAHGHRDGLSMPIFRGIGKGATEHAVIVRELLRRRAACGAAEWKLNAGFRSTANLEIL